MSTNSTSSNEFEVNLIGCSIGDHGCKFLVRGLYKCVKPQSKVTSKLALSLVDNNIHEEGAHHIAQLLKNTSLVCRLNLSSNPLAEGGLNSLCEALSTNTTLEYLSLSYCSLTIHKKKWTLAQSTSKYKYLSNLSQIVG